MRSMIADKKSPIVYGYTGNQLPVYFSQDPVLNARAGGPGGLAADPGVGENITPNATPVAFPPTIRTRIADTKDPPSQISDAAAARQAMRQFGIVEDTSSRTESFSNSQQRPTRSSSPENSLEARLSPIERWPSTNRWARVTS